MSRFFHEVVVNNYHSNNHIIAEKTTLTYGDQIVLCHHYVEQTKDKIIFCSFTTALVLTLEMFDPDTVPNNTWFFEDLMDLQRKLFLGASKKSGVLRNFQTALKTADSSEDAETIKSIDTTSIRFVCYMND